MAGLKGAVLQFFFNKFSQKVSWGTFKKRLLIRISFFSWYIRLSIGLVVVLSLDNMVIFFYSDKTSMYTQDSFVCTIIRNCISWSIVIRKMQKSAIFGNHTKSHKVTISEKNNLFLIETTPKWVNKEKIALFWLFLPAIYMMMRRGKKICLIIASTYIIWHFFRIFCGTLQLQYICFQLISWTNDDVGTNFWKL